MVRIYLGKNMNLSRFYPWIFFLVGMFYLLVPHETQNGLGLGFGLDHYSHIGIGMILLTYAGYKLTE